MEAKLEKLQTAFNYVYSLDYDLRKRLFSQVRNGYFVEKLFDAEGMMYFLNKVDCSFKRYDSFEDKQAKKRWDTGNNFCDIIASDPLDTKEYVDAVTLLLQKIGTPKLKSIWASFFIEAFEKKYGVDSNVYSILQSIYIRKLYSFLNPSYLMYPVMSNVDWDYRYKNKFKLIQLIQLTLKAPQHSLGDIHWGLVNAQSFWKWLEETCDDRGMRRWIYKLLTALNRFEPIPPKNEKEKTEKFTDRAQDLLEKLTTYCEIDGIDYRILCQEIAMKCENTVDGFLRWEPASLGDDWRLQKITELMENPENKISYGHRFYMGNPSVEVARNFLNAALKTSNGDSVANSVCYDLELFPDREKAEEIFAVFCEEVAKVKKPTWGEVAKWIAPSDSEYKKLYLNSKTWDAVIAMMSSIKKLQSEDLKAMLNFRQCLTDEQAAKVADKLQKTYVKKGFSSWVKYYNAVKAYGVDVEKLPDYVRKQFEGIAIVMEM